MQNSKSSPPRSYEAPNLADYEAGDVSDEKPTSRQLMDVPVYSHFYYEGGAPHPLETFAKNHVVEFMQLFDIRNSRL